MAGPDKKIQNEFLFLAGSFAYPVLELIWRGKTHYSMALVGGICMVLINNVCCDVLGESNMLLRCLAGAVIITEVELTAGLILNGAMKLNVWDYSDMPYNILGQICLPYFSLWYGLSLPAVMVCEASGRLLSPDDRPKKAKRD